MASKRLSIRRLLFYIAICSIPFALYRHHIDDLEFGLKPGETVLPHQSTSISIGTVYEYRRYIRGDAKRDLLEDLD